LPGALDAAAFGLERVAIVGELGVERELLAGILAGRIEQPTPGGKSAELLEMTLIDPPSVLERGERTRVATV